jgi:hypothetical protein
MKRQMYLKQRRLNLRSQSQNKLLSSDQLI